MSELESQSQSIPTPANATVSAWIRSHLTALFQDVHSQDAFDRTFSPACEVRLNHAPRPLQTFKDEIAARRTAATHVNVAWSDAEDALVATPTHANDDDDDDGQPAVVAGTFVVTHSLPFRIRVTPAQRQTHVHFSARVEKDPNAQDGDQRRITSFYYTSVDRTPRIHFPVPRTAPA